MWPTPVATALGKLRPDVGSQVQGQHRLLSEILSQNSSKKQTKAISRIFNRENLIQRTGFTGEEEADDNSRGAP